MGNTMKKRLEKISIVFIKTARNTIDAATVRHQTTYCMNWTPALRSKLIAIWVITRWVKN